MALERFRVAAGRKIDFWLMLTVLAVVAFGLMMISSASVVVAWKEFGSNYFFLVKQLWAALAGIIALVVMTMIDYRFWQRHARWVGIAIVVMLALPHIPGLGVTLQGAQRWVHLGGLSIQFSEPVKLAAILYLAAWLAKREHTMDHLRETFVPFVVTVAVIVLPILLQPDAGTAMILAVTLVALYCVAGAIPLHMGYLALLGAFGFLMIIQSPYRAARLLVFLNPNQETLGAGYHISQALLAIGSGGWLGLGFGESNQKYLFLPEIQTDSIFAVATEELGFLRMLVVLALLAVIIIRGFSIARTVPDRFGQLVAFGITTLFALQALINIAAMLGLVPLTGIPLPLVSYGGSALVTMLAAFGILLSISKHAQASHP